MPHGSILGPLLFNIFISDLFLFLSNSHLSNYANDNTLYAFGNNLEEIKNTLHFDFDLVSKWFEENYQDSIQTNVILCALVRILKMNL